MAATTYQVFNGVHTHLWTETIARLPISERHLFQYVSSEMKDFIKEEFPDSFAEFGAGNTILYKDFHPTVDNISLEKRRSFHAGGRHSVESANILYCGQPFKLVTPWMRAPFGASAGFQGMKTPMTLALEFNPDNEEHQEFQTSLEELQEIIIQLLPKTFKIDPRRGSDLRFLQERCNEIVKKTYHKDDTPYPPYLMAKMSPLPRDNVNNDVFTVIFNHQGFPLTTPDTDHQEIGEILPWDGIYRGMLDLTIWSNSGRMFSISRKWSHLQTRPDKSYEGGEEGVSKATVGLDFHRIKTYNPYY